MWTSIKHHFRALGTTLVMVFCVAAFCVAQEQNYRFNDESSDRYFRLVINGKPWTADHWNSVAYLQDDGKNYSVVFDAERSAMDQDTANIGWQLRFYVQIPKSAIDGFKGSYKVARKGTTAQALFSHGEFETLDVTGTLTIQESEVIDEGGDLSFHLIKGSYHLRTKAGHDLKGTFKID